MKTRPLRPEQELLLLCVSALPDGASHSSRIHELLASGISWSQLLAWAARNEIVPAVYRRLSHFEEKIPPFALAILRNRCARIASWNLALASELLVVLRHLKRNGIQAAAFKGPALAVALYSQLGLRHCRDLDVLIEAERVWDTVRILEAAGYLVNAEFPRQPERKWLKAYKDVALRNPVTGVYVELHWAVCEPAFDPKVHASHLWRQSETVTLLGEPVPFPAPDALLFLLAIHGMRHYWNSLKWISDIDRCLTNYSARDWNPAIHIADRLGRRRTLLLPLKLCQSLMGTPLPAGIFSLMDEEADLSWLVGQISDDLFKELRRFSVSDESLLESLKAAESDISKKLFRARAKDSWADRLRYVALLIRQFLEPDALDKQSAVAKVFLVSASLLMLAGSLVAAVLFMRAKSRVVPDENFNSAGFRDLKLPFTISCATSSSDAAPVYVALRGRNRKELNDLSSERRMLAVEKGSPVRMSRFGQVVGVKVEGGAHAGAICFVPPDVVSVIHKHAVHQ